MQKPSTEHGQLPLPLDEVTAVTPDTSASQPAELGDATTTAEATVSAGDETLEDHVERVRKRVTELEGKRAVSSSVERELPDDAYAELGGGIYTYRRLGKLPGAPTAKPTKRRLTSAEKNKNFNKHLREHKERTPGSRHRSDYG